MSFRLEPKSVALNDLERRNNGVKAVTNYHALFHRIRHLSGALRKSD